MMQQNFANPNASYTTYGMQMAMQPAMQAVQPVPQPVMYGGPTNVVHPMPVMQMQPVMAQPIMAMGPITHQPQAVQALPTMSPTKTFGNDIAQFSFANGGGLDQQQDGVTNAVSFEDVFMEKEVKDACKSIMERLQGFADQFHAQIEEADKLSENILRSLPSKQTTIVKTIKAIDVNTKTRVALKLDIAIRAQVQPATRDVPIVLDPGKNYSKSCACCCCLDKPPKYGTLTMLNKTEVRAVLAKINEGAIVNDSDAGTERTV